MWPSSASTSKYAVTYFKKTIRTYSINKRMMLLSLNGKKLGFHLKKNYVVFLLQRKLRSPSIYQKIEVVFHLPKNEVVVFYWQQNKVAFLLQRKLRLSSIYNKLRLSSIYKKKWVIIKQHSASRAGAWLSLATWQFSMCCASSLLSIYIFSWNCQNCYW